MYQAASFQGDTVANFLHTESLTGIFSNGHDMGCLGNFELPTDLVLSKNLVVMQLVGYVGKLSRNVMIGRSEGICNSPTLANSSGHPALRI